MIQIGADGKAHIRVGKLNLVDLAGSERQAKTGSTVSSTRSISLLHSYLNPRAIVSKKRPTSIFLSRSSAMSSLL